MTSSRAGCAPARAASTRTPRAALCPADGTVSQAGRIAGDTLVQAKGIDYSAAALLGGDAALAAEFAGGDFATIYLAPHNYHRVHMPLAGTLRIARFVPGDLFSVNAATAASVPGLFARNERIACVFDTTAGPLAVVLVGALFVGSMSLAWAGRIRAAQGARKPRDLPVPRPDHRARPRRRARLVQHGIDRRRAVRAARAGAGRRASRPAARCASASAIGLPR